MKRSSDWVFSQENPSDIIVQVGGATFNLHKFPLTSKSGYIRRALASGAIGTKAAARLELTGVPGGAEAFELAARFCYGLDLEITVENVAMLRCAAEHLEMAEEYAAGNLISRTEAYLECTALASLAGAVAVLRRAEALLPASEKVRLVGRCIDAIADMACSEGQLNATSSFDDASMASSALAAKAVVDWWADELTAARIDTFQRVLIAMKARGLRGIAVGPLIMLYAQKALRSVDMHGRSGARRKPEPREEHEKRVVVETLVSLLPRERNALSVSFLSTLLRAAAHLDTTLACRLDLERRMAAQLAQAALDDLLLPSPSPSAAGATAFDVDAVQRILASYLEGEAEAARLGYCTDDELVASLQAPEGGAAQVARLVEGYLAEVASDPNLGVEQFTSLAGLVPERARFNEDGMYRAIDIYLKAHPTLSDVERKKVCSAMDCQKLSREACAHAAQNDRLPVQTVVQVLYYEQRRLHEAPSNSGYLGAESPAYSCTTATPSSIGRRLRRDVVPDEVSRLQRENDELKMELLRMRMAMREHSSGSIPASEKPPLPVKKSLINTVSKKLGRLNPFLRLESMNAVKTRSKPPKDRRHSIS